MRSHLLITPEPIVLPPETWPSREIGACVEFKGMVREMEGAAALTGLHYEAYEPMALSELQRLLDDLATQFPCEEVTFIHRVGWVPVGEASVYVRVLAKHRAAAFQMCAAALDRLKQDVPIWKSVAPPAAA